MPTKHYAGSASLGAEDLAKAEARIRDIAEATYEQPPRFCPGWHCARCDGAVACALAGNALADVAGADVPAGIESSRLVEILDARDGVLKLLNDAEKIMRARLAAGTGGDIGGWYLANAGSDRKWADDVEVGKVFADHPLRGELLRVKPATVPQAEKILGPEGFAGLQAQVVAAPRSRALRKRRERVPTLLDAGQEGTA